MLYVIHVLLSLICLGLQSMVDCLPRDIRWECLVWSQVVRIERALSSKAIVTQSLCNAWYPGVDGVAVHCAVQSYCVDLLVRLLVCCLGRWAWWSAIKKLLTTSLMSEFSVWTNGNFVGHSTPSDLIWYSTEFADATFHLECSRCDRGGLLKPFKSEFGMKLSNTYVICQLKPASFWRGCQLSFFSLL